MRPIILFIAVSAAFAEHDSRELVPGTTPWHYAPGNAVMEEGHRRIREWRKEVQAERDLQLDALRSRRALFKSAGGGDDVLPAPVPPGTEHSFARGMLRGKWRALRVTNTTSGAGYGAGVRLDRTVYDPEKNVIYALTTERNLVEAPLVQLGSWTQRNQAVFIEKKGFAGVKVPGGAFRLVGAINGVFRYSDDAGLTWTLSTGGDHNRGAVTFTEAMGDGAILSLVRKRTGAAAADALIRSLDYGKTFQELQTWPAAQSNGFAATRLYNTADHVLIVRNRSAAGTWDVYQYKGRALTLLASPAASGSPASMTGTFHDGKAWAYVGVGSGGGYVTEDGVTWTRRAGLRSALMTVHPTRPGFLFNNDPQHDYTLDGGNTWQIYSGNDNTIGWDPKHLTWYPVKGVWTFVAANDMGLCFSEDPLDRGAWKYANDNHSYAILHGGTAVDHTALTLTANQDPGTFELTRTGPGAYSARNRNSADGLRVAASNGGKAYWYRHYWESFMHGHAGFTKDNRKASYDIPGTWSTPPFKGSTAPGEDAIYVTGQARLFKLVYNPASNSVSRVDLPYDFQASAGGVAFGIGTAKSDPKRLYVATRNGRFFRSTDAGQTWTETGYTGTKPTPQTSPAYNQNAGFAIEVADMDPELVYWAGGSGAAAVLLSKDGGRTFAPIVTGLPAGERVNSLGISPDGKLAFSNNYFVYIAAENAWSDLKAESMPTGALPFANGVNYLPLQRKVRYFTWGSGVLDLEITHLDTPDHRPVALDAAKCYRITASHSGKSLALGAGNVLEQRTLGAGEKQDWAFFNVDGFHRISHADRGAVLEVTGVSHADPAPVGAGTWEGGEHQLWNVVREADGEVALIARHSVKALEVVGAATADGAKVQQATWFGKAGQRWKLAESPGCLVTPVRTGPPARRMGLVSLGQGRYRVSHPDGDRFTLVLFDAAGRKVAFHPEAEGFAMGGLPAGRYHVKIEGDHILAVETLIHAP